MSSLIPPHDSAETPSAYTAIAALDARATALVWKDLIGDIVPKTSGPGTPAITTLTGDVKAFAYAANDTGDCVYHMPHDWAPGTDLFLHVHWTHNGTDISGSFVIDYGFTYAKGHQQASFSAGQSATQTLSGLTIGNTPTLWHRVDEFQLSSKTPAANQLDTNLLEVDGLIVLHFVATTIPSITGGSGKPFILTLDIHYQSDRVGTPNRSPDFY